jgi:RNA polymerase sigma-70 factor (ECF subfamily)
MPDEEFLTQQFEANRAHLHAVAFRMLGSRLDADDAVQEAWLRLHRVDSGAIDNLGGWLTTVTARIALDMLRARGSRREEPSEVAPERGVTDTPEDEAMLADTVGAALIVVLDTLSPAERLAFVLQDMFGVPFDDIATILGRSPAATKMLASRARQKVRGNAEGTDADPARQRAVVDAFLAASRAGDFDALVALLHPDIALEADAAAAKMGSPDVLRGAAAVANMFCGRAEGARPAVIDGAVGFAWAVAGRTKVAWDVAIVDGKIAHIDMLAARDTLAALELEVVET